MLKKQFEQYWTQWLSTSVAMERHLHDRRLNAGVRRQSCEHCLVQWQDCAGRPIQRRKARLGSIKSSSTRAPNMNDRLSLVELDLHLILLNSGSDKPIYLADSGLILKNLILLKF